MSALIDAPRQSNLPLTCTILCRDHHHRATPNSHPDCRALLIKIVVLHQYFGDITIDHVTKAIPDRTRSLREFHRIWEYGGVFMDHS